jgi:hypothetical protein
MYKELIGLTTWRFGLIPKFSNVGMGLRCRNSNTKNLTQITIPLSHLSNTHNIPTLNPTNIPHRPQNPIHSHTPQPHLPQHRRQHTPQHQRNQLYKKPPLNRIQTPRPKPTSIQTILIRIKNLLSQTPRIISTHHNLPTNTPTSQQHKRPARLAAKDKAFFLRDNKTQPHQTPHQKTSPPHPQPQKTAAPDP